MTSLTQDTCTDAMPKDINICENIYFFDVSGIIVKDILL